MKKTKKKSKGNGKSKGTDLLRTKMKKGLVFKLSEADLARMMNRVAALDVEIDEKRGELKEIQTEMKADIDDLETKRRELSKVAEKGEELRTVDCEEERDYVANAVRYYHKGTLMEERVMSAEERQVELKLAPPPKTKRREAPEPGKVIDLKKRAAGDVDKDDDIASVIKEETSRLTKHTSTDGPRDNPEPA